ncbi:MAG: excinuclease ABC subunit UvrB [Synergistetes bacterium]|nr:MAG: UvrABC system protein B [bacterium 42_11]MBC7331426.1 excinuclease ABC subunit UvrB [Synergistota bacterium]
MAKFKLVAPYPPQGDQPQAIEKLVEGIRRGYRFQTLLGVTGSGKTFTMANVIEKIGLPTLVIAHNKTLAAQLYSEFREFFPYNAVRYFVSYYDYYQPEAYVPETDTYIEKDASINEEIEKLRLSTTKALLEREDVIVVATVSCIYGIGSRREYERVILSLEQGMKITRRRLIERLIELYYERNDLVLERGKFRVRGDIVEIYPPYEEVGVRIEFFGDEIDRITEFHILTGRTLEEKKKLCLYPAKHFVTSEDIINKAVKLIEMELEDRVKWFKEQGKYLEAERLELRTRYDLELLKEVGYCPGIENYSRYLSGREPGEPPGTLLDFFPEEFLMFIDESHMTVPQIRGMYNGDRSRKETLVEYGFRLPSALDNRPLKWDEFQQYMKKVIFVSATPGEYELEVSSQVVEQLVRPTGIVDPEVEIRPAKTQVDDLLKEIAETVNKGERVLVNTLTKKMAEDLAAFLADLGIKVKYLHSEIDTIERAEILKGLRLGEFDVLVGVNLLREGLDLPEVSLVAILDADRQGFLRSERSLIQMIGRAARNVRGKVILYADEITDSLQKAVAETERRRRVQIEFNKKHGIIPRTIVKEVKDYLPEVSRGSKREEISVGVAEEAVPYNVSPEEKEVLISSLEREMWEAVKRLDFERAAEIRDILSVLKGGSDSETGKVNKPNMELFSKRKVNNDHIRDL